MKLCSKCRQPKPEGGHKSYCPECWRKYQRGWRDGQPEKQREYKRRWEAAHPEEVRAAKRANYARNRELRRDQQNAWREANPEKIAAYKERFASPEQRARRAERRLIKLYGITRGTYDDLLAHQHGLCPICERDLGAVQPHVDHCHDTGAVRGILCGPCNQALGLFRDDPVVIRAAAMYVSK